jgi:hypothetical protein
MARMGVVHRYAHDAPAPFRPVAAGYLVGVEDVGKLGLAMASKRIVVNLGSEVVQADAVRRGHYVGSGCDVNNSRCLAAARCSLQEWQ